MNFIANESATKLRGGYYTPADLAAFLARWVAGPRPARVLEPSCGDGAFIRACAAVAAPGLRMTCFELDPAEAETAARAARETGVDAAVTQGDFLGWALREMDEGGERFDAAVGNPPFIRYQYLPERFQVLSERIFARLSCRFTKHTNAWVPFVLASVALLRPGGRLAMVVPSEIIQVIHAQSLRTVLGQQCRRVVVVDPKEIWFEDTLQGAVILMAEKRGDGRAPSEGLGILPVRGRSFARRDPEEVFNAPRLVSGRAVEGKWTRALLPPRVLSLLDTAEALPAIHRFRDVAEVDVGIVTGANAFFLVPDAVVEAFGLRRWAHPMFGRSNHSPGVVYDEAQHRANARAGLPTNFLWFPDARAAADPAARAYIQRGEAMELHTRFKCRVRSPWFSVPSVRASEVGMLKRCHDAPRLILNRAGAFTTDTAYRIRPRVGSSARLVASFLNPLTALSAELEGRTYGGGVLELVPSEIERLLVPLPAEAPDVDGVDRRFRSAGMEAVLTGPGAEVLAQAGLSREDGLALAEAWSDLRHRRQRTGDNAADDAEAA
jgi:adenine-specific DNA methylase